MIKAIVFDLDDTLVSETEFIKSGFNVIADYISTKYSLEQKNVYKTLLSLYEKSSKNVFNRLFDFFKIKYCNEDIVKLIEIYRNHQPVINLFDDVLPILNLLKEKGYKLGLITDGFKESQRNKIKVLQLETYIPNIIVTDELGREFWKPSLVPFEKMQEKLQVNFNEMVYIGDNVKKDFLAGNQLGILTIQLLRENSIYKDVVCDNEYLAKYVIHNINDLLNYI